MLKTELVQAESAVIEAGISLAKLKVKSSALRAHIELDNDKLCVIARELSQLDRDIRHPRFTVAGTQ